MEMSTISLFGPSQTLPLICEIPSKDNTQIIFAQVLKEMPLISQDLMLCPLFLFGKGLRPEMAIFIHTHTKSVSFAKPKLKLYLFYYTMAHIY